MLKYTLISLFLAAALLIAQQPTQINFNLVQVNQYQGQQEATKNIVTPGQRVVIDVNNPQAANYLQSAVNATPVITEQMIQGLFCVPTAFKLERGVSVPIAWDCSAVIIAPSGQDSFLVRASKTGCPGTEVRPSVSVAFASGGGWSDPPIRFGPLTSKTVCALGGGQQLEVSQIGASPPSVRLITAQR
jgi:hypothetical protein